MKFPHVIGMQMLLNFSFLAALGEGSKGYYTHYKFEAETGLPQLLFSSSRIDEDHKAGYHFSNDTKPNGEGWQNFEPKKKLVGTIERFKF